MTDKQPMLLYTAAYDSVSDAMADLDAIEQLHQAEMTTFLFGMVMKRSPSGQCQWPTFMTAVSDPRLYV